MKDLVHNIKVTPAWAGATINTNTNTDSTIVIDTQGYESIEFAVYSGAITDGAYELNIRETDSSDGTTGAAEVASYQEQEDFTAANDAVVKVVAAELSKRYCTLRLISTGTTTGGVFKGALAILGNPRISPTM